MMGVSTCTDKLLSCLSGVTMASKSFGKDTQRRQLRVGGGVVTSAVAAASGAAPAATIIT